MRCLHVRRRLIVVLLAILVVLHANTVARAETTDIRIAHGYGLSYLPVYVVQDQKLIEKHGNALGLADMKPVLTKVISATVANDLLLSGSIELAIGGVTVLMTIADRTSGRNTVRGVMALSETPVYLITTDPRIKSMADYREGDRIAVTGLKVTLAALLVQMAAAKEFGWEQRFKLDPLTVALSHPDSVIALLGERHEVKSHAATVPYNLKELTDPRGRVLTDSFAILGQPHTTQAVYAAQEWKTRNPTAYKAVTNAFEEAMEFIKKNPRAAAEIYLRAEPGSMTMQETLRFIEAEKDMRFSTTPRGIMAFADFMFKVGLLRGKPESWKQYFFDNVYEKSGD
jgi:ABC-type nitrate/sulfonate/bicarbonate transport system substrate-binding protein